MGLLATIYSLIVGDAKYSFFLNMENPFKKGSNNKKENILMGALFWYLRLAISLCKT